MSEQDRAKRRKRVFTPELRAGAVKLVLEKGVPFAKVARDLDLVESSLRNRVRRAQADAGGSSQGALNSSEREGLQRLRKDNRILAEAREILNKPRPSSRRRPDSDGLRVHRRPEGLRQRGHAVPGGLGGQVGLLRARWAGPSARKTENAELTCSTVAESARRRARSIIGRAAS
jgi:transposase-like protein